MEQQELVGKRPFHPPSRRQLCNVFYRSPQGVHRHGGSINAMGIPSLFYYSRLPLLLWDHLPKEHFMWALVSGSGFWGKLSWRIWKPWLLTINNLAKTKQYKAKKKKIHNPITRKQSITVNTWVYVLPDYSMSTSWELHRNLHLWIPRPRWLSWWLTWNDIPDFRMAKR